MTRLGISSLAFLATIAACGGANSDKDDDGLSREDEEALGLDPENADTDGDGLDDGAEVSAESDPLVVDTDEDTLLDGAEVNEHGTSPILADTDDDGYLDPWELTEGSDPVDEKSRIYEGNWPYNPEKDDMRSGKAGDPLAEGDLMFRHKAKDQHKDKVDLGDFAMQGNSMIIDVSAGWCGPCRITSDWLAHGADADLYGYEPIYGGIRTAIKKGDMYWITVLSQGDSGSTSTWEDIKAWDEAYPNPNIPVLMDDDAEVMDAIVGATGFFPSAMVANQKLNVEFVGGVSEAMDMMLGEI